jgi:hypothetical protein
MRSMVPLPDETEVVPGVPPPGWILLHEQQQRRLQLPQAPGLWDESSGKAHWRNRQEGQPFFAIFNSTKSHESQIRTRPHQAITDPGCGPCSGVPPRYTGSTSGLGAVLRQGLRSGCRCRPTRLQELAEAGLAEETIVFYYGDHGSGMPRSKRWPSNSGLHVPMVVYFPQKWRHLAPKEYQPGGRSERMVNFVDLAPTLLSLVGIKPPDWMQGRLCRSASDRTAGSPVRRAWTHGRTVRSGSQRDRRPLPLPAELLPSRLPGPAGRVPVPDPDHPHLARVVRRRPDERRSIDFLASAQGARRTVRLGQ